MTFPWDLRPKLWTLSVRNGLFVHWVRPLLKVVPRGQVHVVFVEEMAASDKWFGRLVQFLGIDARSDGRSDGVPVVLEQRNRRRDREAQGEGHGIRARIVGEKELARTSESESEPGPESDSEPGSESASESESESAYLEEVKAALNEYYAESERELSMELERELGGTSTADWWR